LSPTLLILKIYTTFKDVQMVLKHFFDTSTGFRYKKMKKSSPSITSYHRFHGLPISRFSENRKTSEETDVHDLGHWQCKNWPCSYLWHAYNGIYLKFYKDWVSLSSIIRVKSPAQGWSGKMKISVHLLRSPWLSMDFRVSMETIIPR
jgi:hypothetical protein